MKYAALVPGKVVDFDISRGNSYADETIKYFRDEAEAMIYAIKNPTHSIIQYEEVALGFVVE